MKTQNLSLMEIVAQLRECGYQCEAGSLEQNTVFQALSEKAAAEQRHPIEIVVSSISTALVQWSMAALLGAAPLAGAIKIFLMILNWGS